MMRSALNIKYLLFILVYGLSASMCGREEPGKQDSRKETHMKRLSKPTSTETSRIKQGQDVLLASREEICVAIKNDPRLLKLYHGVMGESKDPLPDDIGKLKLAVVMFITERDKLIVEKGKKIDHPIFSRRPEVRPFIAAILMAHKMNINLDIPLDDKTLKYIDELKKKLVELTESVKII